MRDLRIEEPISSDPVATECTLRDTCSAAAATTFAWEDVSSAEIAMVAAAVGICCDDAARLPADAPMSRTASRTADTVRFRALPS